MSAASDCDGLCALLAAASDDNSRVMVAEALVREAYAQLMQVGRSQGVDSCAHAAATLAFLLKRGFPAIMRERDIALP